MESYHIDKVLLVWNAIPISGYASDTFIEVERDEDGFTTYTGALGDVCRTRSLNLTGKITVTLMATAPINSLLAAAAQEDELTGTGFGPIQLKDLSGGMFAEGAESWVMKRPKIERGKESGTVQWVFAVAKLYVYEGGNAP